MLNSKTLLQDGLAQIISNSNNVLVKLVNYTVSGNSYDDIIVQIVTGSSWLSGIEFPVRSKMGSDEALLLQQGKLLTQDKVLFLNGSAVLNSSGLLIGLGSPTPEYYTIISEGIKTYSVNNVKVYQKLYLRHTIPGSLF
jgi:hypothetical protein